MDLKSSCKGIQGLYDYFMEVRSLEFESIPDYELLRQLLGGAIGEEDIG